MQELLKKWIDNDFADFAGASVTGTIPIPADQINEVLAELLRSAREEGDAAPPVIDSTGAEPPQPAATALSSIPDPRRFLKWLTRAEVRADDGKVTLDFEIRR